MSTRLLPRVVAHTHPPRYRLHKYWSRKPYNVVQAFVGALVPSPGVVVDPFIGSGVVAREAAQLGHTVYASDINPVSLLLTETTCSPPDPARFSAVLGALLDRLEAQTADLWTCPVTQQTLRYVVHEVVARCPSCGSEQSARTVVGQGRARKCGDCGHSVRLNLDTLLRTAVVGVAHVGDRTVTEAPAVLHAQQAVAVPASTESGPASLHAPLVENRRILAFGGMTPASLFTPRVLHTLLAYEAAVQQLDDPALQRAARLLLTASAAQCSRLTAYRNNLTTGGPAWSVPGFWVPPRHLETNPLVHLRARLRRFEAGLADAVAQSQGRALSVHLAEQDARTRLDALRTSGVRADLVVLDPPYGDSVPFVEFSAFWNALLGRTVHASTDLSVSDREPKATAWPRYQARIQAVFAAAADLLAPGGAVLVAFNNHDLRAWRTILEATQQAGLWCVDVVYQAPAVVSSKAAFHPKGSYLGDFWAVFRRAPAGAAFSNETTAAEAALKRCASFRDGVCARNLVYRTLALTWLQHNLAAAEIDRWDALVQEWFTPEGTHRLRWRGKLPLEGPRLVPYLTARARALLADGPMDWKQLCSQLAEACAEVGAPDPAEVRQSLTGVVEVTERLARWVGGG